MKQEYLSRCLVYQYQIARHKIKLEEMWIFEFIDAFWRFGNFPNLGNLCSFSGRMYGFAASLQRYLIFSLIWFAKWVQMKIHQMPNGRASNNSIHLFGSISKKVFSSDILLLLLLKPSSSTSSSSSSLSSPSSSSHSCCCCCQRNSIDMNRTNRPNNRSD